jgi:hypothetical protein
MYGKIKKRRRMRSCGAYTLIYRSSWPLSFHTGNSRRNPALCSFSLLSIYYTLILFFFFFSLFSTLLLQIVLIRGSKRFMQGNSNSGDRSEPTSLFVPLDRARSCGNICFICLFISIQWISIHSVKSPQSFHCSSSFLPYWRINSLYARRAPDFYG